MFIDQFYRLDVTRTQHVHTFVEWITDVLILA